MTESRSIAGKDYVVRITVQATRTSDIAAGKAINERQIHDIDDLYTEAELEALLKIVEPINPPV